jgi:hypothetical protein
MIRWGGSDGSDTRLRNKENIEPAPEASPPDENEPHGPGLGRWVYALLLLAVVSYVAFPEPSLKFLLFLLKLLAFVSVR